MKKVFLNRIRMVTDCFIIHIQKTIKNRPLTVIDIRKYGKHLFMRGSLTKKPLEQECGVINLDEKKLLFYLLIFLFFTYSFI